MASMEQHGRKPWAMELDVATMFTLLAQVQLALRHPAQDGSSRAPARLLVNALIVGLYQIDPILAEVANFGNRAEDDAEAAIPTVMQRAADGSFAPMPGQPRMSNDELAIAVDRMDRSVAGEVDTDVFEPRTALAMMSLVVTLLGQMRPGIEASLTMHRTETAAQAAVSRFAARPKDTGAPLVPDTTASAVQRKGGS